MSTLAVARRALLRLGWSSSAAPSLLLALSAAGLGGCVVSDKSDDSGAVSGGDGADEGAGEDGADGVDGAGEDGADGADGADGSDGSDGTEDTEWGYSGDIGPEYWGELDEEWAACAEGEAQSPIDITGELITTSPEPGPVLGWGPTTLRAYNPGHYIRYEVDSGSTLTWGGNTYELDQFHFHGLSEHTVDGTHFDAEVHFVHVDLASPTRLLVIAAFVIGYDESIPDPIFGADGALRFRDALALPEGETPIDLGGSVDLSEVFTGFPGAYPLGYSGSLTTPPCSEGVQFFISDLSMPMASVDLEAFLDVYDYNYRPVQPLNGRALTVYGVSEPG
ncbi:MAG: carbonic anhydrase family protein [Deltaproteobacteria bacterium]|nr:carbonic anhydrase family protein [Deltaproteobacteria bacterium]